MKLHLFTHLAFASLYCFSQPHFQKGYFIGNDNRRVECFIDNKDWKNDPDHFSYKADSVGSVSKASITDVKEFGIGDQIRYIHAFTKWDTSEPLVGNMSSTSGPAPLWKEDTLFLQVLIEGKANLYKYRNASTVLYFYSVGEGEVEQLVYKKYLREEFVKENKLYLYNFLKRSNADLQI